ncbi:hypothetical protein NKH98_24305 [Mesorhizobium sp. M0833]|uniref:DUF7931 domain-containing protein n=1 Tax=unclassified Mesorhizobium TaxID=325217 RepID=UPI003337E68D
MSDEVYRAKIDRLIREMSGEVVLNGSHIHASIIIERMFARASSCIRILSRTFDPRIYGAPDTVAHANLFLGLPNRKAEVLIEEPHNLDTSNHPFFHSLVGHPNLQIRVVPQHLRAPIQMNFSIMDNKGLRFEKDNTETAAIALFGESPLTNDLIRLFDRVWQTSAPMNLRAATVAA